MNNTAPASRRTVLKTGLSAFAAGLAAASSAQAQDKLAQNLVQYQGTPKDGHMCINCAQFVAPNACKVVAGEIKPQGWCVAFAPKG
jgi:hypothetical protein